MCLMDEASLEIAHEEIEHLIKDIAYWKTRCDAVEKRNDQLTREIYRLKTYCSKD